MSQKLRQAFRNIKEIEPSVKLAGLILSEIGLLREKQAKRKIFLSYFSLAGSFGVFFLAVFEYGGAFFQSEFWSLLRLLSTDVGVVVGNGSDFTLSLLETFPLVSMIIILIPVFALLLSISVYFKSIQRSNYNYF
ncbi:MAG TPA: hypothetical protein DCS28_00490 [Candidatus Moranbacteria bacterium]|nr:hypothetical protein [Candidatus Moranbacteria bacterium]HAT74508.1 hypothetical protein [Candidatus Moranbacteria bacterium]